MDLVRTQVLNQFRLLSEKHKTPYQVQSFIRNLDYHMDSTLQSAAMVLKSKKAHCLEAAFLAAAIMEHQGHPPLVLSLESKDGLDHVLYVFKQRSFWGAIGISRDEGLFGRQPQFRSIRDLAWSYFDPYIDQAGMVTSYQLANLDASKANWRTSSKNVWKAENYLLNLPHKPLNPSENRYKKIYDLVMTGKKVKAQSYWW